MRKPIVFGQYVLLERVSVGGMAEIFKAKSFGAEGFEKILAIKRILPSMAEDQDFITMFIDEAKICGQLSHANIAQIYELGKIDNSHFIALEYIWGKDTLQLQNRFRRVGRRMPPQMAAFIGAKVCEGLDYAHRRRNSQGLPLDIIHRDVSPQNILISYDGEVKLIDFGIAKAQARSSKTQAGVLKGKFGYMSPEQVRGLPLDHRSDIFALGTVLWEMCAGERLFAGDSDFTILEKVRNAAVPRLSQKNPQITPDFEAIVMKALSRESADRFSWASEMQDELQTYLMMQTQPYSAQELSNEMKRLFERELKRETIAMQKHKELLLSDVDGSLDGLELDDEYQLDDADVLPEDFDDGATEMESEPQFSENLGHNPTHIFSDENPRNTPSHDLQPMPDPVGSDGPLLNNLTSEPTFIFNGETNLAEETSTEPPSDEHFADHQEKSATAHIALPQPALGKDIAIGILAALVLILSSIMIWKLISDDDGVKSVAQNRGHLVINLMGGSVAKVSLDGKFKGDVAMRKPLLLRDLPEGTHYLVLKNEDDSAEKRVRIGVDEIKLLSFSLKDKLIVVPATLKLTVDPQDAKVLIDGKKLTQRSGISLSPSKEHTLKVSKVGFITRTLNLKPKNGEAFDIPIILARSKTGALAISTIPEGAVIRLNEKKKGKTPLEIEELKSGRYRVEASLDDYQTIKKRVFIKERKMMRLALTLKKASKPTQASVSHIKAKQRPKTKTVAAKSTATKNRSEKTKAKTQEKRYGYLVANTTPWARVFVDGKDTKLNTPIVPLKKIKLAVGKHRLGFLAEGKTFNFTVTIKANKTTRFFKELPVR